MPDSPYLLPPEWSPQARIWLSWPHARADWPGKFAPIPWVFCEMIRLITAHQRVGLLVKDATSRAMAQAMLDRAGATLAMVDFREVKTNRGWMRDCGPLWVMRGGKRTALHWGFNGWAKYGNHRLDAAVVPALAAFTKDPVLRPRHRGRHVVLEGGGLEVDGAGSILVTEEWLLSDTQIRNPGFTRQDYEAIFAQYLGARNTIWLGRGIVGDDTHGHVDDITRFVAPGKIVTAIAKNKSDANYALLQENLKRIKKARDAKGKPFEVAELPMPRPVEFEGQRLPASYANFLITNRRVLVPVFNDAADARALSTLQALFPKREVVGVFARDLVWGLGTLHCLSMQEPA